MTQKDDILVISERTYNALMDTIPGMSKLWKNVTIVWHDDISAPAAHISGPVDVMGRIRTLVRAHLLTILVKKAGA